MRNLLLLYTTTKSISVVTLANALENYNYLLQHGAPLILPTPDAIWT